MIINNQIQQCTKCVMNTTAPNIVFDTMGICNFCKEYDVVGQKWLAKTNLQKETLLQEVLYQIKDIGKNKTYDCLIGISGGMDSSYLTVLAKDYGLRPLIVHFDNGWNSELAIQNINEILNKLHFELYTYVIDWEDFKNLQLAYFNASVVDIEIPTDQLIFAALFSLAKKFKIDYILSGHNFRTEHIMPKEWTCKAKFDSTNMKNIFAKYGKGSIKQFPKIGANEYFLFNEYYNIEMIPLLNLIDYDYNTMKSRLVNEFNYKPYTSKHYESIFTRFYQGYILPKKFKIDKRLAHYSNMICAGFMTRESALKELEKPTYPLIEQKADKQYILKKWNLTEKEFEETMQIKIQQHDIFGYDKITFITKLKVKLKLIYLYKIAYPLGIKKPRKKFYF